MKHDGTMIWRVSPQPFQCRTRQRTSEHLSQHERESPSMPRLEFIEPAPHSAFAIAAGSAATGPTMPRVTARVRLVDLAPGPGARVSYHWTAQVRYPGTLHCAHQP